MTCCNDNVIQLVQGDTRPSLQLVLYDAQNNTAYDLSDIGTQVFFILNRQGSTNAKEAILCQKLPGTVDANGQVTYPPAFSVPGSGGRVEVHWTDTALDTSGSFNGKLQIYWNDGTIQTTFDSMTIQISPAWTGLPMGPQLPPAVGAMA